jgi:hypothetical protein
MTPPLGGRSRVAPGLNGGGVDAAMSSIWAAPYDQFAEQHVASSLVADVQTETPSHELEAERQRLGAQIAATQARIIAARSRADQRDAEIGALLHADLVASQDYIAEMERQHDHAVAAVRAAAEAEIATIIAIRTSTIDETNCTGAEMWNPNAGGR